MALVSSRWTLSARVLMCFPFIPYKRLRRLAAINSLSALDFLVWIQCVRQVEEGQRLAIDRAEEDAAIGGGVFQQYGEKLQNSISASRQNDLADAGVVNR